MKSLFRARFRWHDVDVFFPITIRYIRMVGLHISHIRMVGFNFSPSYDRQQLGRRFSRARTGAEAALPDGYGLGVERLADLMNERRARALGETAS